MLDSDKKDESTAITITEKIKNEKERLFVGEYSALLLQILFWSLKDSQNLVLFDRDKAKQMTMFTSNISRHLLSIDRMKMQSMTKSLFFQ